MNVITRHARLVRLRAAVLVLAAITGVLVASATAFAAPSAQILPSPTEKDLALLAYGIAGATPPYDKWTALDPAVSQANEFKRDAAARSVEANLRARLEQIKGIRQIGMNLDTQFGEYNSRYSEFDFDITNGSQVTYSRVYGHDVVVNLTNGGLAQAWALPPGDAEKVAQEVGNNRYVRLEMILELTRASVPASDNDPITIDARIVEYEVVSSAKKIKLGHVTVK